MKHPVKMRRITAFLLSMLLICTSVPASAFASEETASLPEDAFLVQESPEESLASSDAAFAEEGPEDVLLPEETSGEELSPEGAVEAGVSFEEDGSDVIYSEDDGSGDPFVEAGVEEGVEEGMEEGAEEADFAADPAYGDEAVDLSADGDDALPADDGEEQSEEDGEEQSADDAEDWSEELQGEGEMPPFMESVTVDEVEITVTAPEGVFPEGAALYAEKVPAEQEAAADEAVEALREEGTHTGLSYTFDIRILDAGGNELQPAEGQSVQVSFALAPVADANLDPVVYHLTETEDGAQAGELAAEKLETEVIPAEETVIVETDGFSLYTVEFTYRDLTYVLDGGEEVPLDEILEAVGLFGEAEAVEVSAPELFSASDETGAWIISSHKAFSTEEWMRVTIAGVEYEITVTDSPYAPVDPAPAGRYAITLEPIGQGVAEFSSLWVKVTDVYGREYREDFYTVVDDPNADPFYVLRLRSFTFADAPAKIEIRCSYKFTVTGEAYEELIYEAPFKEGEDQLAEAASTLLAPGDTISFCSYTIDYLDGPLRYIDENGKLQQQEVWETFNSEMGNPDDPSEEKWYAMTQKGDKVGVVYCVGNSNLVLCDGAHIETQTVVVEEGATLRIYGQKQGTGRLKAKGKTSKTVGPAFFEDIITGDAGIGGAYGHGNSCGDIIINGGIIEAIGATHCAGIGGAQGQNSGKIVINGGTVKATGNAAAGIGGGDRNDGHGGDSGEIIINGGSVTATTDVGAAIGGSYEGKSGPITINGGVVKATSEGGTGIGGGGTSTGRSGTNGPITITGGEVTALSINDRGATADTSNSAGIGAGARTKQVGPIIISGGTVTAASYGSGAGIGGGAGDGGESGGTIHISGADTNVIAFSVDGAGIGSGGDDYGMNASETRPSGGNITIDDGFVFTSSGRSGAGIGGGNNGNGGNITINGGYVVASGGFSDLDWWAEPYENPKDSADLVGDGEISLVGSITGLPEGTGPAKVNEFVAEYCEQYIYDLIADAVLNFFFSGTYSGAGIGGGDDGNGGTITINGGVVEAKGGSNSCAAIGHGDGGNKSKMDLFIYEYAKATYGSLSGDNIKIKGYALGEEDLAKVAKDNSYVLIEPAELDVTFDMHGHGAQVEKQTVEFAHKAEQPSDPKAEGWIFGGWYADEAFDTPYDFDAMITGPTTIHAKWYREYQLTIRNEWPDGAEGTPSSVGFSCVEILPGKLQHKGGLMFSDENNWTVQVSVRSDSILEFDEDPLEGFALFDWMFELGDVVVSGEVESTTGRFRIDLAEIQDTLPSDMVLDAQPCLTLLNMKTRTYSVKKTWDIDAAGNYKPKQINAVLQHLADEDSGTWETVEIRELSSANNWEASFTPVFEDEDFVEEDYRIRETDASGTAVLDKTDAGGSASPQVTYTVKPFDNVQAQDVTYAVTYKRDRDGNMSITNTAGDIYFVQMEWEPDDEAFIPDAVNLDMEINNGSGWTSMDFVTVTKENGWTAAFTPRLEAGEVRIRETDGNGQTVYREGETDNPSGEQKYGKAVYTVGEGDAARKYEYLVTYTEDKARKRVTVRNSLSGIIYSVRKTWDEKLSDKADTIYSVTAVLQHRQSDGTWAPVFAKGADSADSVEERTGGILLAANTLWGAEDFDPVPFTPGTDPKKSLEEADKSYRVRELIQCRKNKYEAEWVFDDGEEVSYKDRRGTTITYKTKLLLTAEDEDNASGKEVTGTFRAGYNKYTKKVGWSVTVAASYARENGGCFTIHNRLVDAATKLVVTFDCAGAGSIPIQLVDEGSRVVKPDDPRLEGYIFDGWFKVADNGKSVETERYDFTTPVTTDMTLKAGFQEAEGLGAAPEDEIYPEEVQILLDAGLSATWKGSKVKATWGEVPGATKYVLYAAYCGKKYKKVKTVKGLTATIRKLNGKKLNRKKSVKLYVVAYAGSKKLGRSISAHAAGPENAKYTNASKIRVTKAKISIANGTGRRIRSKVTRADTSKALPKYCAPTFRYASSDLAVASVSDEGRIRANGTGSCVIYVYAQNGISAKVKVTVR